ncbi:hypothetical protein ABIA39_005688 [Nocardia sp. GAS34]
MVAAALDRWGTAEQRRAWLPGLTAGEVVAALAATEAGAGPTWQVSQQLSRPMARTVWCPDTNCG